MVRAVLIFTGVPSSKPKPCIAGLGVLGAEFVAGVGVAVLGAAVWARVTVEKKHTARTDEMVCFSIDPPPGKGLCDGNAIRGEGSPDSPDAHQVFSYLEEKSTRYS